ncbi:MAG: beta-ketoacyl-[acyl-carrier-protein] synthase family protein [Nitrospira sp.]|nr:beta-ketoacyl-[acyl-carrier-protein] synthase family protein [Nitrospira sp.]
MNRRAVITGIGVISAIGRGLNEYWDALCRGVCGIGEVTIFDTSGYRGRLAAEVHGIDTEGKRLSRCDILGLIAWDEAAMDSNFGHIDISPDRIGICMGSGAGGLLNAEIFRRETIKKHGKGRPGLLVPFPTYTFTDLLATKAGVYGPRTTISTACSSSTTAIGLSAEWIKNGLCEMVISGGSESLSETTFSGFNSLRAVDEVPCRPFDRERKGISLGEGAAIIIVEEYSHALKRGAKIYAEIPGYGISGDAYHVTAPESEGMGIVRAIEMAFRDLSYHKEDIQYINAHGTGTPANDLAETRAIKHFFGKRAYNIPLSSTKSMIGHCLGAAGALEAVATILSIVKGILPPTVNYKIPDPECDLDYVPEPRKMYVTTAMSLSVAFGGNNAALVLRGMN